MKTLVEGSIADEMLTHARPSGLLSVKLAASEIIRRRDAEAVERLSRELRQQAGRRASSTSASEPRGCGVLGSGCWRRGSGRLTGHGDMKEMAR